MVLLAWHQSPRFDSLFWGLTSSRVNSLIAHSEVGILVAFVCYVPIRYEQDGNEQRHL